MHVSWIGMRRIGKQRALRAPAAGHSLEDHALRCDLDDVAVDHNDVAIGCAATTELNPDASNTRMVPFGH
jgi:hypothetical protein